MSYVAVVDIHGQLYVPEIACVQYITLKTHSYNNFLHTFVDCEDLVKGGIHLLHRKTAADAFWNAELEDEVRQRGWINSPFAVPSDREQLMQEVDKVRAVSIYSIVVFLCTSA